VEGYSFIIYSQEEEQKKKMDIMSKFSAAPVCFVSFYFFLFLSAGKPNGC
jgi:hypothetical protein